MAKALNKLESRNILALRILAGSSFRFFELGKPWHTFDIFHEGLCFFASFDKMLQHCVPVILDCGDEAKGFQTRVSEPYTWL